MLRQASSAIMVALSLAAAAHAQVGLSTKPNYDMIEKADRVDESAQITLAVLHQQAVTALQAQDYARAEVTMREMMQRKPPTPDANFLMGLTKTGLEKWDEARGFLELAVQAEPRRPEPKTRLGLVYAKFNRMNDARLQREALSELSVACGGTCPDATWIADGVRTLDQALASAEAASRISANALASVSIVPTGTKEFDPADYSLITFSDPHDLYELLTQPGRCEPGKAAAPREPCALILYKPVEDTEDTLAANFKPVFKVVSRSSIWAIHDKELKKIKIENLYYDNDEIIGKKKTTYNSVALVGNAENAANCESARPCLGHLVAQDMFQMYGSMPDSVVAVIWGEGMKDVATTRIR